MPDAGKVDKDSAEMHARQEYGKFEVRRRIYKEALGEAKDIKLLEETAKQLPLRKKRANEA
ncbi:MAG: hypothetical protein WCS96_03920 [Victivallales bacterium]